MLSDVETVANADELDGCLDGSLASCALIDFSLNAQGGAIAGLTATAGSLGSIETTCAQNQSM